MRGTRHGRGVGAAGSRFIPAHAGNTPSTSAGWRTGSVHPRACGEHSRPTRIRSVTRGSSPRMRGTHSRSQACTRLFRFIPAHAGNTPRRAVLIAPPSVHPRACGEHVAAGDAATKRPGSSPRMRGTRQVRDDARGHGRFIPAHAGNTAARRRSPRTTSVRPRACGEHQNAAMTAIAIGGSSPRMRGTRRARGEGGRGRRFIPAHAGNTCEDCVGLGCVPVHPRACGEHESVAPGISGHSGSSPRMRGTRGCDGFALDDRRFIPAHAGNTYRHRPRPHKIPVHPRACGEHMPP